MFDRNGETLAWNEKSDNPFLWYRKYSDYRGSSHIVGYVKYPLKDKNGFYYREDYIGMDGLEKFWNDKLKGKNGLNILETDALNNVVSHNTIDPPESGKSVYLSIDAKLNQKIYEEIESLSNRVGFTGGAAVMMKIDTGEVIALTSYPEYSSQVMTDGSDSEKISSYLKDKSRPFLNKVVDGAYTPGSIVKPYMALAALNEKIIDPSKQIYSSGQISVQNEYFPDITSVFKDWKAHGYVDMRHALAVSSNVYFYAVGGGYKEQKGLGIDNINKYFSMFGFGRAIEEGFFNGVTGTIPSPDWKAKNFNGEGWRLGDTYHTSIGQYGFQLSPIQMLRAVSMIATEGHLMHPSIEKTDNMAEFDTVDGIDHSSYQVVKEGMRLAVTYDGGTAKGLDVPYVKIAAKSGTAELGETKDKVNSWVMGFYPYENPKYAFVALMERGPRSNVIGAGSMMRQVFDWMNINTPEYLK
jgi:penicillin-binding protein 2